MKNGSPSQERTLLLRPFAHEFSQRFLMILKVKVLHFLCACLKAANHKTHWPSWHFSSWQRGRTLEIRELLAACCRKLWEGRSRVEWAERELYPFLSFPFCIFKHMFHHVPSYSSVLLFTLYFPKPGVMLQQTDQQ